MAKNSLIEKEILRQETELNNNRNVGCFIVFSILLSTVVIILGLISIFLYVSM